MADFDARIEALLKVKNNLLIAVSEGIHDDKGTFICEYAAADKAVDAFGHKQMGGTAAFLAAYCEKFKAKTRAIELSTLQRSAAHIASLTDVNEAFASGGAAVKAALEGKNGLMAVFERVSDKPYLCTIGLKDVHQIANDERCVPVEWITEGGTDVSEEFMKYARPLIIGESYPLMVDGIPKHLVLED